MKGKRRTQILGAGIAGFVMVAMLSLPAAAPAAVMPTPGIASLDGGQEVPPSASNATGVAILEVDQGAGTFGMNLIVAGIDVANLTGVGPNSTPFHIHSAPAGSNGGVVIDLGYLVDQSIATLTPFGSFGFQVEVPAGTPFGGTQGGVTSVVADNIADFLANGLYVNVHTTSFASGEIRGQIQAIVPEPGTLALLGLTLAAGAIGLAKRRS